jgi:hypothetical protein
MDDKRFLVEATEVGNFDGNTELATQLLKDEGVS